MFNTNYAHGRARSAFEGMGGMQGGIGLQLVVVYEVIFCASEWAACVNCELADCRRRFSEESATGDGRGRCGMILMT